MTIVLSKQQAAAVDAVMEWMLNGGKVFKLAGYAGSGKTSIAKFIAEAVGGDILYGAFTGKAASVLESKGCSPARANTATLWISSGHSWRSTSMTSALASSKCVRAALGIVLRAAVAHMAKADRNPSMGVRKSR